MDHLGPELPEVGRGPWTGHEPGGVQDADPLKGSELGGQTLGIPLGHRLEAGRARLTHEVHGGTSTSK